MFSLSTCTLTFAAFLFEINCHGASSRGLLVQLNFIHFLSIYRIIDVDGSSAVAIFLDIDNIAHRFQLFKKSCREYLNGELPTSE